MIKDFVYRLVAIAFVIFSGVVIYHVGWHSVSTGGSAANVTAGSSFVGYSWLMSNFVWIMFGVLAVCVLILFFYLWNRRG